MVCRWPSLPRTNITTKFPAAVWLAVHWVRRYRCPEATASLIGPLNNESMDYAEGRFRVFPHPLGRLLAFWSYFFHCQEGLE
jgi:hypothetical protein